jgi:PAS domain S-box-containing protein
MESGKENKMSSNVKQEVEHEQMLREMADQFGPVFDHSPLGVYLYIDDVHKICNERMARMFGLTIEEWNNTPSFLDDFVAEKDRDMFARNYQHHIARLTHPVTFKFHGIRKDGSTFTAETDMIPMCWHGEPIAYHFVREI